MDSSWKMMLNKEGVPYMLFNLKEDPSETDNVVNKPETADIKNYISDKILKRIISTQIVRFN